jgi:hypothetical protein
MPDMTEGTMVLWIRPRQNGGEPLGGCFAEAILKTGECLGNSTET